MLPKENLDKLMSRREERIRAREEANSMFQALPSEKRQSLLTSKKPTRPPKNIHPSAESETSSNVPSSSPIPFQDAPTPEDSPTKRTAPSAPKEKSERTKLRESRRAERQAKEEKEEKDKLAQVRLFNSFFQQPTIKSLKKDNENLENKTDFELTFPPCEYKDMAETNRFYHPVNDELLDQLDTRHKSTKALLAEFQLAFRSERALHKPTRQGIHPPVCVRDIVKTVTESDVLGGNAEERAKRELEKLNNRELVSIKLLQFHLDRRPGWIGTHTRSSTFIRPRRPFGQDPLSIDYSFDSDLEWEDMEEGENVDDALDDREEDAESIGNSEADSEMQDWLEDDLEEDEIVPAEEESSISGYVASSRNALIRDPSTVHSLKPKKKLKLLGRRFDSKLVPYSTGPHWETTLSVPSHDSFAPYQIHLMNDAYVGLDPFSFVSTNICVTDESKLSSVPSAASSIPNAPVPPDASDSSTVHTVSTGQPRTTKFMFPDTRLPELLSMIQGSTRSKPALVEDLREHFAPTVKGVSKAAIEARLQECAMRESKKLGAKWIIRDEFKVRATLS